MHDTWSKKIWRLRHAWLLTVACGCQGIIADKSSVTSVECTSSVSPPTLTPARVRRLTREEFDQSVSSLLKTPLTPTSTYKFPTDTQSGGYTNQADVLEINQAWADALHTAAEGLAQTTVAKLPTLLPCAATANEACAQTFLNTFVRDAYRRPLTTEESTALLNVYRAGVAAGNFNTGIELVLQVVFQSPNFLYRTELGQGGDGSIVLTPEETAAELAYFITGAPPDAQLMAATDLLTADGREREARRLLQSAQARQQISSFFAQWLQIDRLETVSKDPVVFPLFSVALAQSMRKETDAFVEEVVFHTDGTLKTLFSAKYSFIDNALANLYQVPAPSTAFAKVSWDATPRAGLLTQASVLTAASQRSQHSPVRRGKLVRTRMFCQPIAAPPPSLMVVSPPPSTTNTTRQRFEAHAAPSCMGCHRLMDPIGFSFEHYDGIGAYRANENTFAIDSTGALEGTDVDGNFGDALDLSQRLGDSEQVRSCFVQHWQQFGLARAVSADERCSMATRFADFRSGKTGVLDLVVAQVRSDEFITRLPQRN